jgi:hypothetical protein
MVPATQCHDFLPVPISVVFPLKVYYAVLDIENAVVGNSYAMSVTSSMSGLSVVGRTGFEKCIRIIDRKAEKCNNCESFTASYSNRY